MSFRGILPSLIFDGLCPYLTYVLLTAYVPGISEVAALGLSGIFPAAHGIFAIVQRRTVDIIGAAS